MYTKQFDQIKDNNRLKLKANAALLNILVHPTKMNFASSLMSSL